MASDEAWLPGRERAGSPGGFRAHARELPCTQDIKEAVGRVRLGCRFYNCHFYTRHFYNGNRFAITIPPALLGRGAIGHQPRHVSPPGLLQHRVTKPRFCSPAFSAGMLPATRRSRHDALAAGKPVGPASCPSHVPCRRCMLARRPWGTSWRFPGRWLRSSGGWSHLGKPRVTHLLSPSPCDRLVS